MSAIFTPCYSKMVKNMKISSISLVLIVEYETEYLSVKLVIAMTAFAFDIFQLLIFPATRSP